MSTDIYGDETTLPTETSFTLGNRGDDLGVWVTTTVSDDRVFIPLREIRDIKIALESIKIAVASLRNIGIGLSAIPNLLPKHLDGVGQELDGAGELCDSLIGLVRLDEPSPFDRLLGGALGTADSFVDTHDSSPSVGGSATVRNHGVGNPNPTEGEAAHAARNAEAAAKRAEIAALYAVDAGNTAAWVASGCDHRAKPKPTPKPACDCGDSNSTRGEHPTSSNPGAPK